MDALMNSLQRSLLLCSSMLSLAALGAWAQNESTIAIVASPDADLPDAVTQRIPLPGNIDKQDAAESAAGRSGDKRNDGLNAARDALEAAEESLAMARDAAEDARADLGKASPPEGVPDQAPALLEAPDDTLPDDDAPGS